MNGLALGLAAAAGLCNAVGDVLERSPAQQENSDPRESIRLVARLARRPRWWLGVVSSVLGLGLHRTALSRGALAVVHPMLVVELPLAVLGSALFLGSRLAWRDWVAVAAGLPAFVGFLAPSGGERPHVSGASWAVATAMVLGLALVPAVAGWRTGQDLRALVIFKESASGGAVLIGVGLGAASVVAGEVVLGGSPVLQGGERPVARTTQTDR